MKIKLLLFILVVIVTYSCGGGSPATEPVTQTVVVTPEPEPLKTIVLDSDNETLVLKDTESEASNSPSRVSSSQRCDELGRLQGVIYSKVETTGKDGVNLTPCFKNVHYWEKGMIHGQYRPNIDEPYVPFITDIDGKVHHLPNHPKKRLGFKNVKMIDRYNGRPLYLNPNGHLVTFDMDTDEEETVINTPVGNFVVLNKDNGDHVAYHDLAGGKIRRPDGSVESISEIKSTYSFYYENGSGDLGYVRHDGFRNMIFDANGVILERAGHSIPVTMNDFYTNPVIGESMPVAPKPSAAMDQCERSDDLLLCAGTYVKGYVITDSDKDIQEIQWCDYGHCSGFTPLSCNNSEYIYYYSSNSGVIPSRQLTQIQRDLSDSEHILTNIEIEKLICTENGNLLISGLNVDTSLNEVFHFDPEFKVKTMITESITAFIK